MSKLIAEAMMLGTNLPVVAGCATEETICSPESVLAAEI